jgi:hypothetical protein
MAFQPLAISGVLHHHGELEELACAPRQIHKFLPFVMLAPVIDLTLYSSLPAVVVTIVEEARWAHTSSAKIQIHRVF